MSEIYSSEELIFRTVVLIEKLLEKYKTFHALHFVNQAFDYIFFLINLKIIDFPTALGMMVEYSRKFKEAAKNGSD